jgi:F-type H+-transporting ATPase subunit b
MFLSNRKTVRFPAGIVMLFVCVALLGLASACFASETGGAHHADGGKQMKDFIWRCVDFAVLFGIAFWAVKKADVKGSLAARRTGIEKMLQEAIEAKEQAEKKFREYNEKLETANKEIEIMSAAMKQEGELEKVRIIAEAKIAAEKIREQAELAAAHEVLKARAELREEAARLAVELAENKIKANIVKSDQDKLVGEYISKVVTLH